MAVLMVKVVARSTPVGEDVTEAEAEAEAEDEDEDEDEDETTTTTQTMEAHETQIGINKNPLPLLFLLYGVSPLSLQTAIEMATRLKVTFIDLPRTRFVTLQLETFGLIRTRLLRLLLASIAVF